MPRIGEHAPKLKGPAKVSAAVHECSVTPPCAEVVNQVAEARLCGVTRPPHRGEFNHEGRHLTRRSTYVRNLSFFKLLAQSLAKLLDESYEERQGGDRGRRLWVAPQPIPPWMWLTRERLHPPEVRPSFPILYIPRRSARLNGVSVERARDDGL